MHLSTRISLCILPLWVAAVLGDFVNVLNIVLTVKFAASVVIPTVHLVTKGLSDIQQFCAILQCGCTIRTLELMTPHVSVWYTVHSLLRTHVLTIQCYRWLNSFSPREVLMHFYNSFTCHKLNSLNSSPSTSSSIMSH